MSEDWRIVICIHDGYIHCGVITQRGAAPVPGLDGQEVLLGSLKVNVPRHGHEAGGGVDGELPVLVAPDDGVGDLGVDANVPGGGHHPDHVGAHVHSLCDGGKVIFAGEFRWIVVHICNTIVFVIKIKRLSPTAQFRSPTVKTFFAEVNPDLFCFYLR